VLLLLVVPFGLLWMLIALHRQRIGFDRISIRGALVLAYLVFQALLLAITEITSVGHNFTAGRVALAWLVVIVVLLVVARSDIRTMVSRARSHRGSPFGLRTRLKRLSTEDWVWLVVIVVILGVLVAVGSLYPPSNGDSMVYHLARVEHWIQNRTIAPFATHYVAQIDLSPLSEYNLAHLHLLSGTDRFDWSMQWSAAVVCVVGVSELARLLGASRSLQITASVICATIPSGILLATSTENDYFAAATGVGLLIIIVTFSFGRKWAYRAVALGMAAGLAYMAKGTMPAMLGPAVLAFFAVAVYRRHRDVAQPVMFRKILIWCAVTVVGLLAVAGPFAVQSSALFGSALGPTSQGQIIAPVTPNAFAANIVRSTAGNFDIGDGVAGIDTYVSMLALGVLRPAYSIFGVHQEDSRFAFVETFHPLVVQNFTLYERLGDFGANPWHVLLAMVALVVLIVGVLRGSKRLRLALVLAIGLSCGYLFFSGLVKWSPFEVRYSMPLLVAWSAVIAVAMISWPRWLIRLVLVGLVIACLPQLFDNADQPLVPPTKFVGSYLAPYFALSQTPYGNAPASAYQTIATMLAQSTCTHASLGNWVLSEYPLWVGLQHEHYQGVLNDFDVNNVTRKLEPTYTPCATITQQTSSYRARDNSTVNVQEGDLALSLDPNAATTVRVPVAGFNSAVRGVRMLPGGGWFLELGSTPRPVITDAGSVFLFTQSPRKVQLQFLQEAPGATSTPYALSQTGGTPIPSTNTPTTITADVELHRGANRIDVTPTRHAAYFIGEVTVSSAK
jgi:hypothetical protein